MEQKTLHRFLLVTSLLSTVLMVGVGANATTVEIISYNIEQTPESGFGCWNHNYAGTITDTGYTVSGSVNCAAVNPARLQNYYNGSGTLNDGLFDTTHLFITTCPSGCRYNDQSGYITPVITLNLEGTYTINEIRLLKGDSSFTDITGVTVQIGTSEIQVTPIAINDDPRSIRLNLIGTNLEILPTNQITLKNFSASFNAYTIDQFGIGEIQVDGLPDADGDGIPDAWELLHFGNTTDANGYTDWDKDGYTDLKEYLNEMSDEKDPEGAKYDPKTVNAPGGTGYVDSSNSDFWTLMIPVIIQHAKQP